jgi:transposase-like protein
MVLSTGTVSGRSSKPPLLDLKIKMLWNQHFITKFFDLKEKAFLWCQQNGMLPSEIHCPVHQQALTIEEYKGGLGRARCRKGECRTSAPIMLAAGTWFGGARLSIYQEMSLIFSYSRNESYENAMTDAARPREMADQPKDMVAESILGSKTVAERFKDLRRLIMEDFLERQEYRGKIGGPGKIVQIDESKFGKRKYNRGRHTDGHWVLGLIEDGSEDLRLILCPNNKRGEADLLPIIQKHVAPGTEIHTDCWKAYDRLDQVGYIHKTVNHSDKENPFVAPDGTHTARIEASWRPGKDHFRKIHIPSVCSVCNQKLKDARIFDPTPVQVKTMRAAMKRIHRERNDCEACGELEENFAEKLVEYQWRRECKRLKKDPMEEVLGCIRRAFPI